MRAETPTGGIFQIGFPSRPRAKCEKLSRETTRVLALPQVRQRFDELGCDLVGNTPEEFASAIKAEAPRWAKLVDQLGLKID
jgi:tripartite-type tricarboxylate transporter receptor subunit TctC